MKIKTSFMLIILAALLMNSAHVLARQAASPAQDWASVRAIAPGEKLSVRLKDGKNMEGKLVSASDAVLVLDRGNKTIDLSEYSIAKVYRLVKRPAGKAIGKSIAIGAGIGFGIGAGVGIYGGTYEDLETTELVALLGGVGAAIGAGAGAIVGALGSKQRRVLVYEAK